ncbi:MAG: glycosyltransferase [Elusimicrobia bacterium]|nr:glycosyltransferase [Elusimicrobiota bacterium]
MSETRLEGRRVLVVGGGTFPGLELALRLHPHNEVLVLDASVDARVSSAGVPSRRLDPTDFSDLAEALGELKPDAVALFAGDGGEALSQVRSRVLGLVHLLEALRLDGRKVPCVVAAAEPAPGVPAALAEAAEALARAYASAHGLRAVVARHSPSAGDTPLAEGVEALLRAPDGASNPRLRSPRKPEESGASDAVPDVSVVIPARNEAENLPLLLDELDRLRRSTRDSIEVIVVDDRSSDATSEVARRTPGTRVMPSAHPAGKGGALRTGFEAARGKFLCMMDADFSHRPQDLPALLAEARTHGGLVIGSRLTGGSEEFTRVRAFGNIVLTLAFGLIHGRYVSDALNGYKVFGREVFTAFDYTATGYEIEIELLVNTLRLGRPITEVPSRERARLKGEAKSKVIKDGTRFLARIVWEGLRPARRKA